MSEYEESISTGVSSLNATPSKSSSSASSSSSNLQFGLDSNVEKNQQKQLHHQNQNGYSTCSVNDESFFNNRQRSTSLYYRKSLHSYYMNDKLKILIIYIYPILIIFSLGLRIWSLIVVITKMKAEAYYKILNYKTHEIFDMYISEFSFPEMMRDFWDAKAYAATILIAFGSAFMPLLKYLIMILLWFIPFNSDHEYIRRKILFLFDQFGRIAFVDLFFLCYVVRIFYTDIEYHFLGIHLDVSLTPEPVYGIFIGLIATITSTMLSHVMLYLHDKQQSDKGSENITVASGPPTASILFRVRSISNKSKHTLWFIVIGTSMLYISVFIMAVLTYGKNIVSFEQAGLIGGIAAKSQGKKHFSVYDLAQYLPDNTDKESGAVFLVTVYLFIIFIFPVALFFMSIGLWVYPMTVTTQKKILAIYPFLHSWCALDVLFATTLVCYLNMHLIGKFTFTQKFNDECNFVQDVFEDDCMDLKHDIDDGFYMLLVLSLLHEAMFLVTKELGHMVLERVDTSYFGSSRFRYGVSSGSANRASIESGSDLTFPFHNREAGSDGFVVNSHPDSESLQNSPFGTSSRAWLKESSLASEDGNSEEDDDRNTVHITSLNAIDPNKSTYAPPTNPLL